MKTAIMKSWKTTLGGVAAALVMIFQQVQFALDDSPDTVIDWNIVAVAIGLIFFAVNSRDNDVSSESAGVK